MQAPALLPSHASECAKGESRDEIVHISDASVSDAAVTSSVPGIAMLTDRQVEAVARFTKGRICLRQLGDVDHEKVTGSALRNSPLDACEARFALSKLWEICSLFQRHRIYSGGEREDSIKSVNSVLEHLGYGLQIELSEEAVPFATGSEEETAALNRFLDAFTG